MGIQTSKIHATSSSRTLGKQPSSQDDVISKATDFTEDSTLPPSPRTGYFSNASTENRPRRRVPHRSTPNLISRSSASTLSSSTLSQKEGPPLTASLMTLQDQRRTVPVNIPPRKSGSEANLNDTSLHQDDTQYLVKLYDSRTWEMYKRITEARRNSSYECNSAPSENARGGESTSEWENLQHDHLESLPSGHEMIFLFDFD